MIVWSAAVCGMIAVLGAGAFGDPVQLESVGADFTRPQVPEMLDLVGNRADKNSVGHGRNVALYTGRPSRFFFATHELGPVFSAVDGDTIVWYPDHVAVNPSLNDRAQSRANPPIEGPRGLKPAALHCRTIAHGHLAPPAEATGIIDRRQVCVTRDDVVVAQIRLHNPTDRTLAHRVEVTGDCRDSRDWRDKPGGKKTTRRDGDVVLMFDHNVFPEYLPDGLCLAIGGNVKPGRVETDPPGTYRLVYDVEVSAGETRSVILACALDADENRARRNLADVLRQADPIARNRRAWQTFYDEEVPRFSCSDRGLTELYGFRWFLLRFSTAGGELGYFKYPVVMEGRQAYQTYCCYSAPFMAFDMNWAVDPRVGFGHIASMVRAAYDDGRLPWYTSPRTNRVKIHHRSGTGLSLLPHAAAHHYRIHGDKRLVREIYPGLKANVQWWIKDRDPNGDGLFDIDHPLETGMDDLVRWRDEQADTRYDALDASCYAALNLRAVALLARALGHQSDADYFAACADKTARAINALLWDADRRAWFDRNPRTGKPATHYLAVTTFYPFFAGLAEREHLSAIRKHLLNPARFWLPYPVPALPRDHPQFDPNGFWRGPSWPAATSHVVEALAATAKSLDRSLLPQAAELLRRAARVHLRPRADFHERYNPLTGRPLSTFRDYMHSWWIDVIIRHVAGLEPCDEGRALIDPLPLGLEYFALRGAPLRGRKMDVLWRDPATENDRLGFGPGLTLVIDGKTVVHEPTFRPGDRPIHVPLP